MYAVLNNAVECNGIECKVGLNNNLQFVDKDNLAKFIELGGVDGYIADVEIPLDAKVDNWKSDRLIIKKIVHTKDHPLFQDEAWCLNAVQQSIFVLKFIKNPSEAICLAAVRANGVALQYIETQTHRICMDAVKNNPEALIYVKNKTNRICLAAVRRDGLMLQYVENQPEQICQAAIQNTGHALFFIHDQDEYYCYQAISQNPYAINHIRDPFMKEMMLRNF